MTDLKKLCYWLAAACCLFIGHGSARADDLDSFIQRQSAIGSSNSNNDDRAISQREADDLIMNAMSLIGVGYRWGGTSPVTGMDCSGFMQYIFRKSMSINLPRTSAWRSSRSARRARIVVRLPVVSPAATIAR